MGENLIQYDLTSSFTSLAQVVGWKLVHLVEPAMSSFMYPYVDNKIKQNSR